MRIYYELKQKNNWNCTWVMLVNNKYPIVVSTEEVHCCADISISVEIYRKRSYITVPIYIANCDVPLTMYGVSVS